MCWDGLFARVAMGLLGWDQACVQALTGGHWPWFGMLPVCRGWQEVTSHELGFSLYAEVAMVWDLACVQGLAGCCWPCIGIIPVQGLP
ncbi:hypothetical protein EDC04DRAFT_2794581 [Pisolithus marmoratus]|nr:hypothetical protein EDC04DRAFT_2794581 [Pisolithus marmoratus]